MNLKFVILSAGEGKRLRPYTNQIPKSLVEIAGKSILEWQLSIIKKFVPLTNIYIITGYKSELIRTKFPELRIYYNKKYHRTNMVYSLFCAKDILKKNKEDLIIVYGDILFDHNVIKTLIDEYTTEVSLISYLEFYNLWSIRMGTPIKDIESFKVNKHSRVYELGQPIKDISNVQGQFTGLIKIKKEYLVKLILEWNSIKPKNRDNMFMTDFLQRLILRNWHIKAVSIKKGWLEVDSVSDKELYERLINSKAISNYIDLFN